jgi:hypothetical protein
VSTTVTAVGLVGAVAPVTRRVRAYFAPVNRDAGVPTVFDAAQMGAFELSAPPAPWVDLGWCSNFARKSATKIGALTTGAPAVVQSQVVTQVEATVQLEFESWGKLQLALAAGSQQMNLLQGSGEWEWWFGDRCDSAAGWIYCDFIECRGDGGGAVSGGRVGRRR